MSTEDKDWALIKSHLRQMDVAVRNLNAQGYETYCPMLPGKGRSRQANLAPMFPDCIFVRTDDGPASLRSLRSTIGVRHVLVGAGKVAVIPEAFVAAVRILERDAGLALTTPRGTRESTSEEFGELVARILATAPRQRLFVLTELFEQPSAGG